MTIYTLGYSGWKLDDIRAAVDRLDAVLVDVRMVPRSRCPQWNGSTFFRMFGDRYVWLKEFGNRNYKGTVEQIVILDFPAGEKRVADLASGGRAIILLCGCADVNQCHRKVLAERLAEAWSANVVHLTSPAKQDFPGQARLC